MWLVCNCGYPAPHLEMIRHESSTMAMTYLHMIFEGVDRLPDFIGFDNMCGLAQYAMKRKHKTPFQEVQR